MTAHPARHQEHASRGHNAWRMFHDKRRNVVILAAAALVLTASWLGIRQQAGMVRLLGSGVAHAAADSASVASVALEYHAALANGDSAAALSLLGGDAVILESGDLETRDEYRTHHLPADIQFARAVPSTRGPVRVFVRGDVAWAVSTSTARGTFRDRSVNSQGAELMVLTREREGWKIQAIHWSSHALRQ